MGSTIKRAEKQCLIKTKNLLSAENLQRRRRAFGQVYQGSGFRDESRADELAHDLAQTRGDRVHPGQEVVIQRLAVLRHFGELGAENEDAGLVVGADVSAHRGLCGFVDLCFGFFVEDVGQVDGGLFSGAFYIF